MEEKEVVPNLKDNVVTYFQEKMKLERLEEQAHLAVIDGIHKLIDQKANENFDRITIDKSEVMAMLNQILDAEINDNFLKQMKLRDINRDFDVDSTITILEGGFATVTEKKNIGIMITNIQEKEEVLFLSDKYYSDHIPEIEAQIAELEKQFSRKDIEGFEEQYSKDIIIKQYELDTSMEYENEIKQLNEKNEKYNAVRNRMIGDYGKKYQEIISRDISEKEKQELLKQLLEETKSYDNKSNQAGWQLEAEKATIEHKFENSSFIKKQMEEMHLFDKERYLQDKKGEIDPKLAELYSKRNQMNDDRIKHRQPVYVVKKSAVASLLSNIAKTVRGEKEPLLLEYHPDREITVGVNPIMDDNTQKVDENLIKTLASLYGKQANDERKKSIDTTEFETDLVKYFRVHYQDLMEEGYNNFLNKFEEMPTEISPNKKEGELAAIARKHHIDPKRFHCFGYKFSIREGLIYKKELALGLQDIYYVTDEGMNSKIEDLYGETLYGHHTNTDSKISNSRKLKNDFIEYAKKHGIKIKNEYVLETMQVNQDKVDAISKYANEVVNQELETNSDYTEKIAKDISENYSTIMNLNFYNVRNLDSVKELIGDRYLTDGSIKINDDHIISNNMIGKGDVIYATPEYCAREYESTMQEIEVLQKQLDPIEHNSELEQANQFKSSLRKYIAEQGMEIDTSIKQVPVDTDKVELIADAIALKYSEKAKKPETFKADIIKKLQENWSEIMTEAHRVDIRHMFEEELKKDSYIDEDLQIAEDCIYLSDVSRFDTQCIYATPEFLQKKIADLDEVIATKDEIFARNEERIRNSLTDYAKEKNIPIKTRSASERLRQIEEQRQKKNRPFYAFERELYPDDPTARPKIEQEDNGITTIKKMAEDNLGASKILFKAMLPSENPNEEEQWKNYSVILGLDDMNIRGSQIWTAYKDYCHEDMDKFKKLVHNRDADMVQFINEKHAIKGAEKAVTGGASFDRTKKPNMYRFTAEEVELYRELAEQRLAKKTEKKPKEKRYIVKRKKREDKIKAYRERLINQGKETIARKQNKKVQEDISDDYEEK